MTNKFLALCCDLWRFVTSRARDRLTSARPHTPRTPRACGGPHEPIAMRPLAFGARWATWVPDATRVCLARSDRKGSGEEVFHNTTRPHAATSDEGSSTVPARRLVSGRLVGGSREDGGSANAAGLVVVLVPTKMGGSSHYEWPSA